MPAGQLRPGSWRSRARATIQRVILAQRDAGVRDPHAILAAIDDAYPFGMRQYDPYKMWLLERKAAAKGLFLSPLGIYCRECKAPIGKLCRGRAVGDYHAIRDAQPTLAKMPLFDGGS